MDGETQCIGRAKAQLVTSVALANAITLDVNTHKHTQPTNIYLCKLDKRIQMENKYSNHPNTNLIDANAVPGLSYSAGWRQMVLAN